MNNHNNPHWQYVQANGNFGYGGANNSSFNNGSQVPLDFIYGTHGNVDISCWAVSHCLSWLESIGLGKYGINFTKNHMNGRLLMKISTRELKEDLQITSLGHRDIMINDIKRYVDLEKCKRKKEKENDDFKKKIEQQVST